MGYGPFILNAKGRERWSLTRHKRAYDDGINGAAQMKTAGAV